MGAIAHCGRLQAASHPGAAGIAGRHGGEQRGDPTQERARTRRAQPRWSIRLILAMKPRHPGKIRMSHAAGCPRLAAEEPLSAARLAPRLAIPRLLRMNVAPAIRRRSTSNPGIPNVGPKTALERILRALELGRRGQILRKLGDNARSGRVSRTR